MRYLYIILLLVLLAACGRITPHQPTQPTLDQAIGLKATYFSNPDFTGAQVTRIDRFVYFDWGKIAPTRDFAPGAFSVRWQGDIKIDQTDSYEFLLSSNGKTTLRLDGKTITGPVTLQAGKHYFLELEFIKTGPEAAIKLEWLSKSLKQNLVPQEVLYPVALEGSLNTQAVTPGVNLLLNSNFEGGTGGWIKYGGNYQTVSPGNGNTGNALSASGWAWVQQDLPVTDIEVGQLYTLRANVKALAGATCTVGVAGGAAGQVDFRKPLTFQSPSFQEQGVSLTVPSNTVWMSVYIASSNETCHFDDLSLIAGDTTPPPPPPVTTLLVNGSFESDYNNWGQFGGTSVINSDAQEGSKAAQLSNYAWVQQNIAGALLKVGSSYRLSSYAKAAAGQSCTLGFVAATPTATLFSETITFTETTYTQKTIEKTITAEVSWAAVYLASSAGSCTFDTLSLSDPAAVQIGNGTGLLGEYYDELFFTGTQVLRTDTTINFSWAAGIPVGGIAADTFSVRWAGQIQPLYSGSYTFYTTSDDGIRLWINGQRVVDNWTVHSSTVNQGTITLSAGQKYSIRLEYFENGGDALAKLEWSSDLQTRQVVPATQLYPATSASVTEFNQGKWSSVLSWPLIATHMVNMPDGRVLAWSSWDETTFGGRPDLQFSEATIYNPLTNTFQDADNPQHDMFCAGLSMLADGRVFAGGGGDGINRTRVSVFNPFTTSWSRLPDMPNGHWYGTSVAMPNGEVVVSMGDSSSRRTDIYRNGSWQTLTGINLTGIDAGLETPDWYPYMHVSPRGTVFHSGATTTMHELDLSGNGTTTNKGSRGSTEVYRQWGNATMMDQGKILMTGGTPRETTIGSLKTAVLIDINAANPVVTTLPDMNYTRTYQTSILLPNGEVMVMGGNGTGVEFNDEQSRLIPEIYDPISNTWRVVASMSVPRNYHSTGTLLQDGRVLIAGGGLCGTCAANHQDGQVYTPTYLYKSDGTPADRPVINTTPVSITYNQSFDVTLSGGGASSISTFYLIKLSANTHAMNTDVRRLSVPFSKTATNTYRLTSHSNTNVLTPGYYYLFALNTEGVPSIAKTLQIQ